MTLFHTLYMVLKLLLLITECVSRRQREMKSPEDLCIRFRSEVRKEGVVSRVPLSVEAESFWGITSVCEARRLTRF